MFQYRYMYYSINKSTGRVQTSAKADLVHIGIWFASRAKNWIHTADPDLDGFQNLFSDFLVQRHIINYFLKIPSVVFT